MSDRERVSDKTRLHGMGSWDQNLVFSKLAFEVRSIMDGSGWSMRFHLPLLPPAKSIPKIRVTYDWVNRKIFSAALSSWLNTIDQHPSSSSSLILMCHHLHPQSPSPSSQLHWFIGEARTSACDGGRCRAGWRQPYFWWLVCWTRARALILWVERKEEKLGVMGYR